MRHDIRPLYRGCEGGRPGRDDARRRGLRGAGEPFKLELELLDSIEPGEVVVCTTQGSLHAAMWGELLSTHTKARGGRGAIIDGLTRDAWGIGDIRFPVFVRGHACRLEGPARRHGDPRADRVGGVASRTAISWSAMSTAVSRCRGRSRTEVVERALAKVDGREHRARRARGRREHQAGLPRARNPVNAP